MLEALAAVDRMKLAPEGGGTIRALSRIGYDLPEALADLIDNSIDADARRVEVTFLRNDDEITAVIPGNETAMPFPPRLASPALVTGPIRVFL